MENSNTPAQLPSTQSQGWAGRYEATLKNCTFLPCVMLIKGSCPRDPPIYPVFGIIFSLVLPSESANMALLNIWNSKICLRKISPNLVRPQFHKISPKCHPNVSASQFLRYRKSRWTELHYKYKLCFSSVKTLKAKKSWAWNGQCFAMGLGSQTSGGVGAVH